jgi:hypothetical protein
METIKQLINQTTHIWTNHKKWVIGVAIIIVIAIVAI